MAPDPWYSKVNGDNVDVIVLTTNVRRHGIICMTDITIKKIVHLLQVSRNNYQQKSLKSHTPAAVSFLDAYRLVISIINFIIPILVRSLSFVFRPSSSPLTRPTRLPLLHLYTRHFAQPLCTFVVG